MGAGLDREHDVLASQHTGHRVHTTRDGLSKQNKIGFDSAPLVAQQLASARNAGLDFVADQQHVVLVAERTGLLQIGWVWDNDSCLALDRLYEESSQIRAGGLERLAESSLIIVGNGLLGSWNRASDTGQIRTIVLA